MTLTLCAMMLLPLAPGPADVSGDSFATMRAGFEQPDMRFAPFTFWFWDEPLEPAKMAEMAATMATQRLNPGYAHARNAMVPGPSLPTDQWLSPLWFESFGGALSEAEAGGAYLGYCDEYWWPSGRAAGRVLAAHPELRATSLQWETHFVRGGESAELPESLFTVAARLADPADAGLADEIRAPLGSWIWSPTGFVDGAARSFRHSLELPADARIAQAQLRITADNEYTVWINGAQVARDDDWYQIEDIDVAGALHAGANSIAVEGRNRDGIAGLVLGVRVLLADGAVVDLLSDGSWRCADAAPDGWTEPAFDDSAWPAAQVLGSTGTPPWNLGNTPARHRSLTILSETLTLLGEGPGFVWTAPEEGVWRVYSFRAYHHPGVDGGDTNMIDERLAPAFLEIAHEPYARQFPREMGRAIPGVFIDNEGDYGWKLAWSETLERLYRDKTGRDLRPLVPLLFEKDREGQAPRVRWEWFDAVSDCYAAYFAEVNRWLAERGMYCISNLWEESLAWQAGAVGDFMKLQRAYTMPGTDCLTLKALQVHDFKETQSVCEFEGRRAMTELMGAGGWGTLSPTTLKQATNAITAWGVSHTVPHGIFTVRRLDGNIWMPDWYTENPMWPYLHQWTDFSRRASFVTAHGQLAADVLLLNPMDSVWANAEPAVFDPGTGGGLWDTPAWFGPRVGEIDAAYSRAISELTDARVEFLVTDRHYLGQMHLERDARGAWLVRPATANRAEFRFHTVVVPPIDMLPLPVARLLTEFACEGGNVYLLGSPPSATPERGEGDRDLARLMRTMARQPSVRKAAAGLSGPIAEGAPGLAPHLAFVSGSFSMLQSHRLVDGREVFWLANNETVEHRCRLLLRGVRGGASLLDCESGGTRAVGCAVTREGTVIDLRFAPLEGFFLVVDPARRPSPVREESLGTSRVLEGAWRVSVPTEGQPPLEHPLAIPDELRVSAERALAPWREWGLAGFSGYVDYETEFELDSSCDLELDLGEVRHVAEVWLNGEPCGARLWAPYRFELRGARAGGNVLRVRVGNLANESYGQGDASGLLGPVVLRARAPSGR